MGFSQDFSHAGQHISRTVEAFFMKFSQSEKKCYSYFLSLNFGGPDQEIAIFCKTSNSSILYFYILRTTSQNNIICLRYFGQCEPSFEGFLGYHGNRLPFLSLQMSPNITITRVYPLRWEGTIKKCFPYLGSKKVTLCQLERGHSKISKISKMCEKINYAHN